MYSQNDIKWKSVVMTGKDDLDLINKKDIFKRWGHEGYDYIGRWGCLITCFCNIMDYKDKSLEITPETLNKKIRERKGYYILSKQHSCVIGEESFLDFSVIQKILDIKKITRNVHINNIKSYDIENHRNIFYIVRVPYDPFKKILTGHYNVVVKCNNGILTHFDSDTSEYRVDFKISSDMYHITEILF